MIAKPLLVAAIISANLLAQPAVAQSGALEEGFSAALHGCTEWVLNPASWASGPQPFMDSVGLPGKLQLVPQVDEAALPPEELRTGNHYWRINATPGAGFILVVSDQLPMCHITGGGDADLQHIAEAVLASADFSAAWEFIQDNSQDDMASSTFRSRQQGNFIMVLSRAREAGGRRDRVQIVATAMLEFAE